MVPERPLKGTVPDVVTESKSLPKKLALNNHDYSRGSLFFRLFVTTYETKQKQKYVGLGKRSTFGCDVTLLSKINPIRDWLKIKNTVIILHYHQLSDAVTDSSPGV